MFVPITTSGQPNVNITKKWTSKFFSEPGASYAIMDIKLIGIHGTIITKLITCSKYLTNKSSFFTGVATAMMCIVWIGYGFSPFRIIDFEGVILNLLCKVSEFDKDKKLRI